MSVSPNNLLPFIDRTSISLTKIQKYPLFEGKFIESLDFTLCKMIIEKPAVFSQETISGFNTAVMSKMRTNGNLEVTHNQRFGLGRFYADKNTSFIPHPRAIKHTLLNLPVVVKKVLKKPLVT